MHRSKVTAFILFLLAGALLFSQTPQWSKEAQKLGNSIRTLDTLLSVNPFPDEVPGLETAIGNKAGQVMADLAALQSAMESEMASLSGTERQEALDAWASLMAQTADVGNRLYIRGFATLSHDLVDTYSTARAAYFTLADSYTLITKRLPIGTHLQDGGGWIPW
jgi:acyl-CoA reductase-like NAD-dependent aldehyde dehydrogenase